MGSDLARIAAYAAAHHSVFTLDDWVTHGLTSAQLRSNLRRSVVERIGRSGYRFSGHPPSWAANLAAGLLDLGDQAAIGGRASAQLMRLDGFRLNAVEFVAPRDRRNVSTRWPVRTACVLDQVDCQVIAGFRTLSASRVIIDSAGRWTETELGNAVDSAIRLGWTSQTYLRRRLQSLRTSGKAGVRLLDRCLDGVGGESWLERETLRLLRAASIAPPKTQVVFRRDRRTLARVDLLWPDANLVVEVAGHGTHASRLQRQRDAQRITELTLLGLRVVTFTYEDVVGRPGWVMATIAEALGSFMSPNLPVAC